jgi:hypothetical protein
MPAIAVIIALVFVLALSCSGSDDGDNDDSADASRGIAQPTTAAASVARTSSESTAGGAEPAAGADQSTSPDLAAQPGWDRKVIRTAHVSISVIDDGGGVPAAMEQVRNLAIGKGGFVFSSTSYVEDERQFAEITIQVPVDQFDQTMNELRSASFVDEVQREESSSQDVSEEYVDNESRLRALRETELRFLDLLGRAETVDDILQLEYELQNVRSQIETIQGRQNYLDSVTAFSTISVSLSPAGVAPRPENAGEGFSFSHIAERAWEHSRGAIEDVLIATLTVAIFSVALLPVAILALIVWRIVRARQRARLTGLEAS